MKFLIKCSITLALLLALSVLWINAGAAVQPGLTIYVAKDGSDNWSGRQDSPSSQKNGGPYATIEKARREIRRIRSESGLPPGEIVVEIRAGTYFFDRPLEFNSLDSGTEESPIVYRARKGEAVRLSGGIELRKWTVVTDESILARLSPSARGYVMAASLPEVGIAEYGKASGGGLEFFFGDHPMTLARWPNEGYVYMGDVVGGQPFDIRGNKGDRVGKFKYLGDRPKRWVSEPDIWAHGFWFWDWGADRGKIMSIDTTNHTITLAKPYHEYGYRKGQWYYIYNALSELDIPGEWYLDRKAGMLYFWPPASMEKERAVVSVSDSIINLSRTSFVTFEGMVIEAARGTSIRAKGCTNINLSSLVVRNGGGWGIRIEGGLRCSVLGSEIYDTGEGGISVSGGNRQTLQSSHHRIENNIIHSYGRWNPMKREGVEMAGVGIRVAHNHIYDAPHQAIRFDGNNHIIEYNEIDNVCKESNDAGAINAGRDWTMRGTLIQYNYIHDVRGLDGKGANGVYLDDMLSGITVQGNIFENIGIAVVVGGGRDNTVDRNVCVSCGLCVHLDSRGMGWAAPAVTGVMMESLKMLPYRSELWKSSYPALVNILDDDPAAPKGNKVVNNLSWKSTWMYIEDKAKPFVILGTNYPDVDPQMIDKNSVTAGFKTTSPLVKLGLWPFKETVGPQREKNTY